MILFVLFMCVLCVNAQGGQKRALDPMRLESGPVVSCWMWSLRTEAAPQREQQGLLTPSRAACSPHNSLFTV